MTSEKVGWKIDKILYICKEISIKEKMGLLLVFLLGAMLISFMCSVLEASLMSTPLSYLSMKEEEGDKKAIRLKEYKTNIDRPIAAILSLNTIANTVGAAGVGQQATLVFGSAWFGVVSGVTTILILVFSEIIPKTIGTSYWKNLIGFTSDVIRILIVVMYPFVVLIRGISRLITPKEQETTISREEVSAMINVGEEEGVFEENENTIIQNLLRIDDIKASDAMTPRSVAATAPESLTLRQFFKDKNFLHHSRIPTYNDEPNFITGYILRSQALELLANDKFDIRLSQIKRNIEQFNEEMSIGDIYDSLLAKKEQISVIIDEYGCFQGILSLEDIIETVLGQEIIDESDEATDMQQYAKERWEKRKDNLQTN